MRDFEELLLEYTPATTQPQVDIAREILLAQDKALQIQNYERLIASEREKTARAEAVGREISLYERLLAAKRGNPPSTLQLYYDPYDPRIAELDRIHAERERLSEATRRMLRNEKISDRGECIDSATRRTQRAPAGFVPLYFHPELSTRPATQNTQLVYTQRVNSPNLTYLGFAMLGTGITAAFGAAALTGALVLGYLTFGGKKDYSEERLARNTPTVSESAERNINSEQPNPETALVEEEPADASYTPTPSNSSSKKMFDFGDGVDHYAIAKQRMDEWAAYDEKRLRRAEAARDDSYDFYGRRARGTPVNFNERR